MYQVFLSWAIKIKQVESNVSLITIYCLRLFVVVYKDEML